MKTKNITGKVLRKPKSPATMFTTIQPSEWMGVIDVAAHLGISKETIYRLLKAKKIPRHRIGKLWLFNRNEINTWAMKK